jgi:hypothetical protein
MSSKGLSHPEADTVRVYANTNWTGIREAESNITALDATAQEILVEIEGAKTTVVASADSTEDLEQVVMDKCHNVEWKPDLDLLSVDTVQTLCDAAAPSDEAEPIEFYTEVDFLLTAFIQRTLKVVKGELSLSLELKHHTKMYLDWMEHQMQLLHDGASPFSSTEWRDRLEDSNYVAQLTQRITSTNKQGIFFTTVGTNLQKLLTGEMDALSVLFQGDLVKDHYYEVVSIVLFSRIMRRH